MLIFADSKRVMQEERGAVWRSLETAAALVSVREGRGAFALKV